MGTRLFENNSPAKAWRSRGRAPAELLLDPGSIPAPSTSKIALYDLCSHTSAAGLPPPAEDAMAWPIREHPWCSRCDLEVALSATTFNKHF